MPKRLKFMLVALVVALLALGPKIYSNFKGDEVVTTVTNKAKSAISLVQPNKAMAEVKKDKIETQYLKKPEFTAKNKDNPFETYKRGSGTSPASAASTTSTPTAYKIDPATGKTVALPSAPAKTGTAKPMKIAGKVKKGDEQRIYLAVGENIYWAQPGRIYDGVEIISVDSGSKEVTVASAGKQIVVK